MLVVCHQEQVIVIFGKLLHVVVVVESGNSLCNIESVGVENSCKVFHERYQQCVVVNVQVLKVEVNARKSVLFALVGKLVYQCHSLFGVAHDASDGF